MSGLSFGVEGGVDDAGFGGADDGGEVVEAGGGNGLHAAEGREEVVLRLRADALDVVEARGELALTALVAVEGDGEAVHLRLDLLEETEGRAVVAHGDLVEGVRAEEEPCRAVAVVLHQPRYGDGEAQLGEGFAYGAYLPLTSVGEDEVGEAFASCLFAQTAVAARDDFAHGGVVVGPFDRTDVELPVVLLRRAPTLEDDAGGYGIGALDIRVVEALDM